MSGMTRTTISARPYDVEKRWIHIDAEGVVVGRLATFIATRLRGKHLPTYTPHVDCGDYVVVTNVDKVVLTGKKLTDKVYYRHTGHPGGVKSTTPQKVLAGRFPERVLEKAVERMLPKESPLARKQMTHLRLFAGATHAHEAQQPETIDFAGRSVKNTRQARVRSHVVRGHALNNSGRLHTPSLTELVGRSSEGSASFAEASTSRLVDYSDLAAELDRWLMNLDSPETRGNALRSIAKALPRLDIGQALRHPELRSILSRTPDRLLQALAESLGSPDLAKTAGQALAAAASPDHYRDVTVFDNEEQALIDLERILKLCEIDSFSAVNFIPRGERVTEVDVQLWDGLPFELNGKTPALASSSFKETSKALGLKLDGALKTDETQRAHGELEKGQTAGLHVTLVPDFETPEPVVLYLTRGGRVFDRYVYEADALFPHLAT